jgi:hemerythrin-like metal-binding protein
MAFFPWDPALDTGIAAVDAQHRRLAEMISDLAAAEGADQAAVRCLTQLKDYVREHFADEEQLLEHVPASHADTHRFEHAAFAARVADCEAACWAGYAPGPELLDYLRDWLRSHIAQVDMELAALVKARA